MIRFADSDTVIMRVCSTLKLLLGVSLLGMLLACNHSLPESNQGYSGGNVKRQLNSDGNYSVRSGDTLYAIAFSYGLDHRQVARWNGISAPYIIYPGQDLRLSPPASSNRSTGVQISTIKTPGKTKTRSQTTTKPATSQAKPPTATSKPGAVVDSSTKKPQGKSTSKPTTQPGSADPGAWKWPTSGRVLRGYVSGNPARNGLDIAGKEGQSINATAAGSVVYSGNGLIGYGELIIIKHSDRMLSAYAHNKRRLVQEGEQVSAGQKIAEMGRNDQNEQLLHFEIRTRGKPVNPLEYLPKK
jgi:lipoprotein NlpD